MNLNLHSTQNEALASINNDIQNHFLLAVDKDTSAAKMYGYLHLDKIHHLDEILTKNLHLYEVIPAGVPVKPFFDLEIERDEFSLVEMKDLCDVFVDFVKGVFLDVFKIRLFSSDFLILDCCVENKKLSYHILIQNKVYFESINGDHKTFIEFLNAELEKRPEINGLFAWSKNGKTKCIMDSDIYTNNRCFRMMGQSKKGKSAILTSERTSIAFTESFVRLYSSSQKRVRIVVPTPEMKSEEPKLKKARISAVSIPKQKPPQRPFIKEGATLMSTKNLTYEDVRKLPAYLQYLYLIPNTDQSRDFYRNVAYALRASGGTRAQFKEWARLYAPLVGKTDFQIESVFAADKVITEFERARVDDCCNIFYLKKYAKLVHPEFFERGTASEIEQYFDANLDGFRVIEEDCEFFSMPGTAYENDIFAPEKLIILDAHMGRGKTTTVLRLIEECQFVRILFLSCRIAFAQFIASEFGCVCYNDPGADLNADRLVISMESLYKLVGNIKKSYDLIVMDECEANLGCFGSETMNRRQREIFALLKDLICQSKKVILASAFITNKTTNFARSLQVPVCYIKNVTLPPARVAEEIRVDDYNDVLLNTLSTKKVYACWSSINQLRAFDAELAGRHPDIHKTQLNYNGKCDDETMLTLRRQNETWAVPRLVQCTSAITVGNSYTGRDFDQTFIRAYPSCNVVDTMQQSMRVRYLKDNKLVFAMPSSYSLADMKKIEIQFSVLSEFDDYNSQKREILLKKCEEYIDAANDFDDKSAMILVRESIREYEETDPALREIIMLNMYEKALSRKYYKEIFVEFLKRMNYDVKLLAPKKKNAAASKKKSAEVCEATPDDEAFEKGEAPAGFFAYDRFGTINSVEADEIDLKVRTKRATAAEKESLQKYFFDCRMGDHKIDDIQTRRELFSLDICSHTKHILQNMILEKNPPPGDQLFEIQSDLALYGIEQVNFSLPKLDIIRELNRRLGIAHSLELTEIPRTKIEAMNEYVHSNRAYFHKVFDLPDKTKDAACNFNNTVAVLNKVYMAWTGAGLKSRGDSKKKSDVFVKHSLYYTNPYLGEKKVPILIPTRSITL